MKSGKTYYLKPLVFVIYIIGNKIVIASASLKGGQWMNSQWLEYPKDELPRIMNEIGAEAHVEEVPAEKYAHLNVIVKPAYVIAASGAAHSTALAGAEYLHKMLTKSAEEKYQERLQKGIDKNA